MDLQLTVVALLIAGATGYLGRWCWRALRGPKGGCGGSCACPGGAQPAKSNGLIPPGQLTLRRQNRDNA
jgi:hypothetical protein